MANKSVTHPFVIKTNKSEQYKDFENFNDKYVIVYTSGKYTIYMTIDTYSSISNQNLLKYDFSGYEYGVDYMFSESVKDSGLTDDEPKMYYYGITYKGDALYESIINGEKLTLLDVEKTMHPLDGYANVSLGHNRILFIVAPIDEGYDNLCIRITEDNCFQLNDNMCEAFKLNAKFVLYAMQFDDEELVECILANVHVEPGSIVPEYELAALRTLNDHRIYLPNLLNDVSELNSDFVDINETEKVNASFNIDTFNKINEFAPKEFTQEELKTLTSTFARLILDLSTIQINDQKNAIYNRVLNYWANEGTDEVQDILSQINVSNNQLTQTSSGCSCSSSTQLSLGQCSNVQYSLGTANQLSTSTPDCQNVYQTYMQNALSEMLGNPQFYKDWFKLADSDEYIANHILADKLKTLLEEFKKLGYMLDFDKSNILECAQIANSVSNANYDLIDKYINVLGWVDEGLFTQNTNKIKTIGSSFGTLLQKLMF